MRNTLTVQMSKYLNVYIVNVISFHRLIVFQFNKDKNLLFYVSLCYANKIL